MKFENMINSISKNIAISIVKCIESAVGDGIREDLQKNNLRTTNSKGSRIWDLLNTALLDSMDTVECSTAVSNRGPWQMVVLFEKSSGSVMTLMREQRYAELKKAQKRRNRMHYVDMLPKMFNSELLSDHEQITLFPKEFADENDLAVLVQRLLGDLVSDISVVRNHVLVLFDTRGFHLTNVRAVMITPNLDIASRCEVNWSKYISSNESIIVQQVEDPESPANNPHHGLKLTGKAATRKQRLIRLRQEGDAEKTEDI